MPEITIEQMVDMKAYLLTQMTLERAQGREDRVQIIQAILAMFDEPNKSYCDGWYKGYKEGWLKGCYDEKKRIVALEGPGEEERMNLDDWFSRICARAESISEWSAADKENANKIHEFILGKPEGK